MLPARVGADRHGGGCSTAPASPATCATPPSADGRRDRGDAACTACCAQTLGDAEAAREVARAAGVRTGDYLLAHRIPTPVQAAAEAAAGAAGRARAAGGHHAATPGPSPAAAAFSAVRRRGRRCVLTIRDNPLCRGLTTATPACDFYAAHLRTPVPRAGARAARRSARWPARPAATPSAASRSTWRSRVAAGTASCGRRLDHPAAGSLRSA
ncbi:MAG: hypothetical protein MZW92_74505 [Comamonadaceae bacterium]|nr:hypothetical protein [Comamonadaceae bacterium]